MNNHPIIGRSDFLKAFQEVISSTRAEFVALYGRRRVGKTAILREISRDVSGTCLFVTGQSDAANHLQLRLFQDELEKTFFGRQRLSPFENWKEAFQQLLAAIETQAPDKPILLVFDELPWLAGRKSNLVSALDHAWNTVLQYDPRIKLIVCGSSASWMLSTLVRAKGGLHNRLTLSLRLPPFSLHETKEYLYAKGARQWSNRDFVEIYLALGGIPYYLNLVRPELSPAENVARVFFSDAATLREEFDSLFKSLFGKNPVYKRIVQMLNTKRQGMTRQEIITDLGLTSGGETSRILDELEESGFIKKLLPFGAKERGGLYRIWDEFCKFWIDWGKAPNLGDPSKHWFQMRQSAGFAIWAGYAFEGLCLKEVEGLRKALGIADVRCWIGPAVVKTKEGKKTQLDLLFDRADNTLTIVEIKHHNGPLEVTQALAKELEEKRSILQQKVGPEKTIQLCLLARDGVQENTHSKRIGLRLLSAECLF